MLIRREHPEDVADVAALTTAAFRTATAPGGTAAPGEPIETLLLDRLRADPAWLPALSLVAVCADGVVGHVVCTRGYVGRAEALGLGPVSVLPAQQRRGVGSALLHSVLGAADALGEPLVCLVGEPAFYARFGFRPAAGLGIQAPNPAWGDYFQARPLSAYEPGLAGGFRYPAAFRELGAG